VSNLLRSSLLPAALTVAALLWTLRAPQPGPVLVAALAWLWMVLSMVDRLRRAGRWSPLALILSLTLLLSTILATWMLRTAHRDDRWWRTKTAEHLERGSNLVVASMESLRVAAQQRARAALHESADLTLLSQPIDLAGAPLEVGISVWRGRRLERWAGPVPGPARPEPSDRPLIVDHGFRRYLVVSAFGDDGRISHADVSLGVTRDLFPRLGVGEEPGRPLSRLTGLDAKVLAEPPDPDAAGPGLDRLVGVPAQDPWVWVGLRALRPSEERRLALDSLGRRTGWGVLVALALIAVGVARSWGRLPEPRALRTMAALGVVVLLGAVRWTIDRAGVLELVFGGLGGSFELLLEPAYFASTGAFGMLRTTLDFLVSGLVVAVAAVLLLPAWLQLVQRQHALARAGVALLLVGWSMGTVGLARVLQGVVTEHANPQLIGLDAPFFTLPFLALHAAMLLTLAAPALWAFLGWERFARTSGRSGGPLVILAAVLLGAWGAWQGWGPSLLVWPLLLPVIGASLRPALEDPSFARRLVAVLVGALWLAGLQSQGLAGVYGELKETVATQDAELRLRPEDDWRRFLLEEMLREIADEPATVAQLVDPSTDRSNLAFELWAASSLSALDYAARIELQSSDGRVISEFDLGLPYEPRPLRNWRSVVDSGERAIRVESFELATEQGPFLVYQGVLDLRRLSPGGDLSRLVIDLPYAARDPAASFDLGPSGPADLGFAVARELPPRRTFERAVLIGRLGPAEVEAASDPALIGLNVDRIPAAGSWVSLTLGAERLRVGRVGQGEQELVVAFHEPGLGERVLDLSRLAALYLMVVGIPLLFGVLVRAHRRNQRLRWPLIGGLGFQERLLGSLLLVVLLPLLILGVFQQRRAEERLREENLAEVSRRLDTALHLVGSGLDDMAAALIGGEYVQEILATGNTTARRDLGPFERSELLIFSPDRRLLLDESLRDLAPEQAERYLDSVMGGQLMLESNERGWYLGRLYPVRHANGETFHVYARRLMTDEELGRLARGVGADLTLFDGPWAVVSSQDYVYKAGLVSPILHREAALTILDSGSRRYLRVEPRAGLLIATGYAGIDGPDGPLRGVISARLFARANEAAEEQRRAQLFLFGLSSLAFVLAVAVGLLVAARIVDPIQNLVAATRRVGRGDLDSRLPESGRDEIGQLIRSFNQMTDELRQSQLHLAARRAFLEAMLGNLSAGVLVIDRELEVIEANAAARRLLGLELGELLARLRAMGPPATVVETEMQIAAQGQSRTLRVIVTPTQIESGTSGWLVLFDDVTELLASRRLALYAEMARQVAHEVKNPLTPIQLSAQMVRQACTDHHPRLQEIVDENVEQIESQVERLRGIASEFSLLGREDLPDLGSVDLLGVLQEVRNLYPSPDRSLGVEIEPLEPIRVLASRSALIKVLTNLVENALQAMGGRGIVRIAARREGARARIRVLDEGPGIPADVEERLFEPYFSTKSTGTGLGLVICRNLMEKMGGGIRLENRRGGPGAAATLDLPVDPAAEGTKRSS
jgi:signal transduction histidine kinase